MPFTPIEEVVDDTPVRKGFTPSQDIQQAASESTKEEMVSSVADEPISKGFTPVEEDGNSNATKAFVKSAVENTVPSVAGLAAFAPGAMGGAAMGSVGGPIGSGIGAIIGGVAASLGVGYVAHKAQESITKDIPKSIKEATGMDKATRKQEEKEFPTASFAGQLAPNLLTFRPGSLETVKMAGREVGPWAQRAILAISGGAFEVGIEEYNGEKLDPKKIALSAVFQGVAATPTKLGEKVMNSLTPKRVLVEDPGSREWTTKDLKENWKLPSELNGVPVVVGTVTDNPHPNSIVSAGYRNRDTGELISTGDHYDPHLMKSNLSNEDLIAIHEDDLAHGGSSTGYDSKKVLGAALPLDEGFITHSGEFKTPAEAAIIAKELHADKLVSRKVKSNEDLIAIHEDELANGGGSSGYTSKKQVEVEEPISVLHPLDFGPEGLKAIRHEPKPAVRADGSPVLARLVRNADGSPRTIILDKDAIVNAFVDKPWTKPKVAGVNPLPADLIKTPADLVQFYAFHEEAHTKVSRPSWVSKADHENLVNELALEQFNETNAGRMYPDSSVPSIPKNINEAKDALFTLGKTKEADNSLAAERLQAAADEGVDLAMKEKWRMFAEGEAVTLTDTETNLFNKYYAAEALERRRLLDYAIKEGLTLPVEMDASVAGFNVARELISKPSSQWERVKKVLSENQKGGFDANIEKVQGAAQERGIFVFEAKNGRRTVIQAKEKVILQWNKDALTGQAKATRFMLYDGHVQAGTKLGSGIVKEARVSEIEHNSPYRYNKDSQAVLYKRLTELREMVRAHEFLKEFKNTDYFKQNAVKIESGKPTPEGFQVLRNTEKIPAFRDYAFTPRVAEVIDDFAKIWTPNALTLISGTLIKNMMLNPIPHMLNEAWHVFNARGLTGWISPKGINRFVKSGFPALKMALEQGPEFRSMLKDGASLLSTDVRNSVIQEGFFKRGAQEFVHSPEGAKLAKDYGTTPLELYDRLSKKSSIAMWVVRDAMYIQQIKEKMMFENLTQKEAIAEVERHMPSYRINARVGEKILGGKLSRGLSQMLQNPNISVFSRYHYGMVNSLVATASDIAKLKHGKAGLEEGLKGLDQAAAIGVAIAVLYPLQDMLAEYLTGNEHAEQRRAGPYHVFHAIGDVLEDKKDPQAILASVFTFNPALLMGAQLAANRKLYNGQPVYNPGQIPEDLTKYFLGQVPQIQSSLRVSDEKTGGGIDEWVARQMDIGSPTDLAQRNREKIQRRNQRAKEHRARRGAFSDGI